MKIVLTKTGIADSVLMLDEEPKTDKLKLLKKKWCK
jgi:hypothetical protein